MLLGLLASLPALAADQRVTLTITLTNLPVTSNTLVFTSPAAKTITWTNVAGSANVVTGSTIAVSTTNLFLQLAAYGVGVPRLSPIIPSLTTTQFQVIGEVNQVIAVTSTGTAGGNWASLTLSTQTVPRLTTVRVPISSEVGDTNRTNVGSLLVSGISDFSTNSFNSNSTALFYHVNTGTNGQRILGPKTFYQLSGTNSALTNGLYVSPVLRDPILTNGINYSNAFRSEGIGGNSLQLGSNAQAKALRVIAIGAGAFGTNNDAIAIGTSSIATNTDAVALGRAAQAGNDSATAIGAGATATGQYGTAAGSAAVASGTADSAYGVDATATGGAGVAIGFGAGATATNATAVGFGAAAAGPGSTAIGTDSTTGATHTNSIALGAGSATTTNNQIMLGSANVYLVQTYARLQADSLTNSLLRGTNRVDGDWAWQRYDASTLANGNNVAAPFTNVYVKASGPTADFAICGIIGGRDGRELKIQNRTAFVMTIAHESGVDPTAANRIRTPTFADITVQSNGWATVIYDAADSRWWLRHKYP